MEEKFPAGEKMLTRKLRCVSPRHGNYIGMTIPKHIVEEMDLHAGDDITVKRVGNTIVITPIGN